MLVVILMFPFFIKDVTFCKSDQGNTFNKTKTNELLLKIGEYDSLKTRESA